MKIGIVIPVRYGSSRFPGKPLAMIAGRTMIERVARNAMAGLSPEQVVIATDDDRIVTAVESFGGRAVMTSADCRNGTERVLNALRVMDSDWEAVINVQGDTPLIPPQVITELVAGFEAFPESQLITPAIPLDLQEVARLEAAHQQGTVGGTFVTTSLSGKALYFSKAPIPCRLRSLESDVPVLKHLGLYGYRRELLEKLVALPPTPLEQVEQLEQLRALEHDIPIQVISVALEGRTLQSIDNPEDVKRAEAIIAREGELLT